MVFAVVYNINKTTDYHTKSIRLDLWTDICCILSLSVYYVMSLNFYNNYEKIISNMFKITVWV